VHRLELFPGLIDLAYTVALNQLAHIRLLYRLLQKLQKAWV
jgi:hypothetical protein